MKIVVFLKVLPDYEQVTMAQGATSLDLSAVPRIVYPFDELALEAALRLKDEDSSRQVVVLSIADEATKEREVIKKALAMGADRAVLVEDAQVAGSDAWSLATMLSAAVKKIGEVDLLMFGIPGIQGEAFQSGAEVAHLLGWPAITSVATLALSGASVEAVREIERGKQTVAAETPAVVTIGKFPWDPRLPTFKGIMSAKSKPFENWKLADLGLEPSEVGKAGSRYVMSAVAPPLPRQAGRKVSGEAAVVAKEAIGALKGKQFV